MIGSSTICRVCVMVQKTRTAGPAAGVDCDCGGESPAAMDVDKLAARIIYIAGAAADLFGVYLWKECSFQVQRQLKQLMGLPFTKYKTFAMLPKSITFCGCLGFYIHYALLRYTKAISPTVRRTAVSLTAVHALLQPSTTSSSCCSGSKSNLGIPYPFSGSKPN
ncbi:unnamed protein product [Sphagnum jensenii]|uniref:Uncharacterized protein n=1 Tax=Sphagnum jensenii TaxID=128206 RepID=A0ABP1AK12_9BRYO